MVLSDANKILAAIRNTHLCDKYHVNESVLLIDSNDKSQIAVINSFENMDYAKLFRNELIETLKVTCCCGEDCACGEACACASEEKSAPCPCNCTNNASTVLFNKVQSCSNFTEREKATLLVFNEAEDFNKFNHVYNGSTDLFKKHRVLSRIVCSLPENVNFVLCVFTFGNLEECIEFSDDPLFFERMKQCCVMDSTFCNKVVMENVN